MKSAARTVEEYLAKLPDDRREAISAVRETIVAHLPEGVEEGVQYGMIGYYVPHSVYPPGYHCDPRQPLPFAALAAQKNYLSVYLCSIYQNPDDEQWVRDRFAEHGKKPDMGKSCIRFKQLEDIPLEVIGEAIARVPVAGFIARYESMLAARRKK